MTNNEVGRWEAAKRTHNFNQTYATELATIPDYQLETTDLQHLLPQIEAAVALQQQDNTGKAANKATLRNTMGNTVLTYTKRAMVKAHRLGNTVLEEGLDHPLSYYTQGAAALGIARATATKDLLQASLTVLTNLAVDDIVIIEQAIADFGAVTDAPQSAGQTKKVHGTGQIGPLLDKADTLIENMGNLIDSYRPDLSADFDAQSRVIELGGRSNSVTLTLQDATTGSPIPGATATNESGTKTAPGTPEGVVVFESIRTGEQTFTVSAAGYATTTVKVKVARGKNTEAVVKMGK